MRVAVEALALLCVLLGLHVCAVSFRVEDRGADSVFSDTDAVEWAAEVLLGGDLRGLAVQRVDEVDSLVHLETEGNSLDGAD